MTKLDALIERAKQSRIDLEFVDAGASKAQGIRSFTAAEAEAMLEAIDAKFRKKEPIFREAARLREATVGIVEGQKAPGWFSELIDLPEHRAFGKSRHDAHPDLHTVLMSWVVMKLREVSGSSNWFRPTEALCYKLAATDLVGAVCGDLKLPVPAFYIELPPAMLYLEDAKTGWHEVRTLTVSMGEITQRTLEVVAKHFDDASGIILGPRLLIECYAEPNSNSKDPFDDSWLFMTYKMLRDDMNMDAVITASVASFSREEAIQRGRIGEKLLNGLELRVFLLKFVLNFCVYLGSDRATVEHQHKGEITKLLGGKKRKNLRKNVQDRIHRLESDRIFLVGTDVVIDPEIKEIVRTEGTSSFKLTYRTLVRGHWRNQAHGPGWTLRRRKWIEPFVRGAELPTKVVGHNYKVE